MSRWKKITGVGAVFGLLLIVGAGWANRHHIDAYLTNDIGAPTVTATAAAVDLNQPPAVRFAVAGDVGTGGPDEYLTAATMDVLDEQFPFDALLLLGDNIYESGDPTQAQDRVFMPFAAVLDGRTELISVLGNHDVKDDNGPAQAEVLGMPELWYSTQIGNTLVIALDSNQPDNLDQLRWLEETLAGPSRPTWTIVILHHPPFSGGWHGSEPSVQEHFVPLFEKYEVDLVLSGHDHDYQRTRRINGVTYVVTGAGAKVRTTGREEFTAVAWSTFNFVDLTIYSDRIAGQAIDHSGAAIDSFVLRPRVALNN